MTRARLVLMPPAADGSCPYLVTDGVGNVIERGQLSTDHPTPMTPMRTVLVVPGSEVLIRWLDLPTRRPAQARAAAAWMLRDVLATPTEHLQVVLGSDAGDGAPRLAAAVSLGRLQTWLDRLQLFGLRPDAVIPDCLTLPEPADDVTLSVRFGELLALRGRQLALTCDPELAPMLAGERPIEPVDDPDQIERMLIVAALNPPIDLLGAASARSDGWRPWRRTVGLAAALLVSPLMVIAAEAARHDLGARALERRSAAAVLGAWPDMAEGADPVAEARRRGAAVGGFTGATGALFVALEQVEGAELDALTRGRDGVLRAVINHPDFADMEALQAALSGSGLTVREDSTLEEDGRIISDVVIEGLQ